MAASEAAESRRAVRAISLLAVLLVAKALTLAGSGVAWSAWSVVACTWQDVLTALVFLALDRWIVSAAWAWALYGAVAGYAAINVPIARTLSTPLTWTILRATGAPLADSIAHHLTAGNLIALALPILVAAVAPWRLGRLRLAVRPAAIAVALALVALGPASVSHADTGGRHRSALGALVATSLPRLDAAGAAADWRASPFGAARADDLSRLGGTLARQNVLLVVLESTGTRHLGLYGADRDPMPNLTALARDGLVFDRAYAAYPESIKGLFALLCARFPAFDTPPEIYADVPCGSLPAALQSAGYKTALFHSGRFAYLGMRSVIDRRGFDTLEDAGAIGGVVNSSFGVDEASAVTRILGWIDRQPRSSPFFAAYLPIAGHHPYTTNLPGPGAFSGEGDFPRYLNALHEADVALGALLGGLRDRHLDGDTLVVVLGDHGEAFGEHAGNFAHTLFAYEENVHVPLVIAAPGRVPHQRLTRQASVVDVTPTILDLVGLAPDSRHEGASLLSGAERMPLFYTDYALGWLGLRDGCWKFLYDVDGGRSRLFDVCGDPAETRDRSGDVPLRTSAYRDRVRQWAAAERERVTRRQ